MKTPLSSRTMIETYQHSGALLFLVLLLSGDGAFILLHCLYILLPVLKDPLLSIETDLGYAEFYQYLKWLWIILILIFVSNKESSRYYFAWILVFTYFLLDDSLQVHERGGEYFATNYAVTPPLGLSRQDFGELAVSAAVGSILMIPLCWAYLKGPMPFRKTFQDLMLLILLLIFFGVAVDTAHSAIDWGVAIGLLIGLIEDGGEMVSVSLILWYLFLMKIREYEPECYLVDCLYEVFTRLCSR